MTQAVIRGKISSSGTNLSERLEDLLTSEVFSRLRYLKPGEAIIPILNRIQSRLGYSSYAWPKKGVVVALPLTSIRIPDDLNMLADDMKRLWESKGKYLRNFGT